jgi:hypothetical protein
LLCLEIILPVLEVFSGAGVCKQLRVARAVLSTLSSIHLLSFVPFPACGSEQDSSAPSGERIKRCLICRIVHHTDTSTSGTAKAMAVFLSRCSVSSGKIPSTEFAEFGPEFGPCSIADITCDSDGEITSFVGENGRTEFLPIHKIETAEDYYVGFFLIGAYQEILGDLHNLFGDTNAVHVSFNRKTNYKIDTVISGDATWESLKYVQYKGPEILKHVRDTLEKGVASRKINFEETSHFLELLDKALVSYTYLGE